MMSDRFVSGTLAALGVGLLTLAGCSNPASDVPEAQISAAKPAADQAGSNASSEETAIVPFNGEHGTINFVGSKVVGGSHDGGFKKFEGQFRLEPETNAVRGVKVTIDMTSLWADDPKLTNHLKNEDFFEVETYPTAEFNAPIVAPFESESSDATHEFAGSLTLHGESKQITIPATVKVTDDMVRLDSEFSIDRTKWGVDYGTGEGLGDKAIRKQVVVRLDIDAPRIAEAAEEAETEPTKAAEAAGE